MVNGVGSNNNSGNNGTPKILETISAILSSAVVLLNLFKDKDIFFWAALVCAILGFISLLSNWPKWIGVLTLLASLAIASFKYSGWHIVIDNTTEVDTVKPAGSSSMPREVITERQMSVQDNMPLNPSLLTQNEWEQIHYAVEEFKTSLRAAVHDEYYSFSKYEDIFTESAEISFSSGKTGIITTQKASEYFGDVNAMFFVEKRYDEIQLKFTEPELIYYLRNDDSTLHNADITIKQGFIGYKKGGVKYQDITVKKIMIQFSNKNGQLVPQIHKISVVSTDAYK